MSRQLSYVGPVNRRDRKHRVADKSRPWHWQLLSGARTVKATERVDAGDHVFYRLRGGMVAKLSPILIPLPTVSPPRSRVFGVEICLIGAAGAVDVTEFRPGRYLNTWLPSHRKKLREDIRAFSTASTKPEATTQKTPGVRGSSSRAGAKMPAKAAFSPTRL